MSIANNFTVSKKFVMEICNDIENRRLKVKWVIQAKIDNLSKEIIDCMKKGGCFCIRTGIESGSNRIIKETKKFNGDWKGLVINNLKYCKDSGIIIDCYILLGLPNETKEDREETLTMLGEVKPDFVQVHYFQPYPGSTLYNEVESKEEFNEYLYHYNCSLDEFRTVKNKIYKIVYFNPKAVIKHLSLFSGFYIRNPKIFSRLVNFLIN